MRQIRALTRLLVPVRGESLESYIDRLAAFHKVNRVVMLKWVGIYEDEQYESLSAYGILLDEARLEGFCTATRLPRPLVQGMLLNSYAGIAISTLPPPRRDTDAARGWAVSEWTFFNGSHACPHCLKEDNGAWQLAWKLPWSFACVKHRCYLVHYCPACQRRLTSGRRDRSLSPLFVQHVPKPSHCRNPQPDGTGRLGRNSLPCDFDLTSIPTTKTKSDCLRVQTLMNEVLSGRVPPILGESVSAQEYFGDLRSLCALILYCAELEDLGNISLAEASAFKILVNERNRILVARKDSATPRNTERMRVVYGRQESAELMSSVVRLAVKILSAKHLKSLTTLILPLTERLIYRTRERWEASKYFSFSKRLSPIVEQNLALRSTFDRAIGSKAFASRSASLAVASGHIPQLLWAEEFSQNFVGFFPAVGENFARRFCTLALMKLCCDLTWIECAKQLSLPVGAAVSTANCCIGILEKTGRKEEFGTVLRALATRIAYSSNKINYGARRAALFGFSCIPMAAWERICAAADITSGLGRRERCATAWLWADLTQGDWRLAPGMTGEKIESLHDVQRTFEKRFIPKLAPYLRAYGTVLLEEIKMLSLLKIEGLQYDIENEIQDCLHQQQIKKARNCILAPAQDLLI